MITIDGVALAKTMQERIHSSVKEKRLLVLLPPGTQGTSYMRQKRKIAQSLGIIVEEIGVAHIEEARSALKSKQDTADGVLVQLPFPDRSWNTVLEMIDPDKDIDTLGPIARARILDGGGRLSPPIVLAVDEMIRSQQINGDHREWLLIGGGMLVGQPLSLGLLGRKRTFTVLEKQTQDAQKIIARADIIVVGTGTPQKIDLSSASSAAFVIDAGATMTDQGISGDVDPRTIHHVSWFSPVPGGLGPLTVTALFANLARTGA